MKVPNRFDLRYFILLIFMTFSVSNADDLDNDFEKFRDYFKKDYFSVGLVLQVVSDFQIERSFPGNNGFNIANARFMVYGEFDKKFGYLMRTNFINSPVILDAKLHYRFSKKLIIDLGQFKAPFSHEFLIPAESIDFVNRSRVVTVMAPGRQIGLQARGMPIQNLPLNYNIGIFNGNGISTNANDDNQFLFVGRIDCLWENFLNQSNTSLYWGINAAFSQDAFTRISEQLNPFIFEPLFFDGRRTLAGLDLRFTAGKFLFSGETIFGQFQGSFTQLITDTTFQDIQATGFHLTTGYMVGARSQLLLRWDNFDTDRRSNSNWLIGGINFWPSSITELQLNYIINTEKTEFKHHQILLNTQVAF